MVLRTYLAMIKFEHSIFALPFAMIGMMWASQAANGTPWPGWRTFGLILLAMVSCRSAAMAYNRIADRDIDALNPRTATRAIPAGLLSLSQSNIFLFVSCALFFLAAGMLNQLTLWLSPAALFVTLFYSRTKRFTPLCHLVLGLSLGMAPAASWIAVRGSLSLPICFCAAAVTCWTAGFDIIYALQDAEFDQSHGLRSIPQTYGLKNALHISRFLHAGAVKLLIVTGILMHSGLLYFVGVASAAGVLIYEQCLVKPTDLSKVNMAFFTLNGFVSIGVFAFALADQFTR